jgi:hypothetical protein
LDLHPSCRIRIVGELKQEGEQVTELTDEERMLFLSLLTVGKRSKTIEVLDHKVTIESLTVADDLRIGLWCKQYEATRGLSRAYQVAVCAAGVRAIDGQPLFQPLSQTTGEEEIFDKKVEYLKDFYPIVISQIYDAVTKLDTEFAEFATKLGKLPGLTPDQR